MSFTGFDNHIKEVLANRYEILNLQGKGGMANVYRAIQIGLDREVAIKVIHPSLVNDEDTVKRFKLEAKSAAKLSHPNIITVYDVGEAGEIVYICLEFLDGADLAHLIRDEGRLRVDQLLSIMIPITSALAEIHDHSLIHRDIKSSNIFITKKNKPILLDFGIATFKESSTGTTLPGTVIGTPEYMSPEQANGRSVGPESDIYSLGIVMFQCLSGNVPFAGDSPISTLVKISQGIMPELDQQSLEIPQWLYDIVMKCLATDPEARFRSANDLLNSLKAKKIVESTLHQKGKTANYDAEVKELNQKLNKSGNIDERIAVLESSAATIHEIYNLKEEISYLNSIKKFQADLNKKYNDAKKTIEKSINLLKSRSFNDVIQQSQNLGNNYSNIAFYNQYSSIYSLANRLQEIEELLPNLKQSDNFKKSSENFIKALFLISSSIEQIKNFDFVGKEDQQEIMQNTLHYNDLFHEAIIGHIKNDKVESADKKPIIHLLLETIKIQGEETARNKELKDLLIDLNNEHVYKNNKLFKIRKDNEKEISDSDKKPEDETIKPLNFDQEFNDLINEQFLKEDLVKDFLSTTNEQILEQTLNRVIYLFYSPKVKDNGFQMLLSLGKEMVEHHKERYAKFKEYQIGEDLFQFGEKIEGQDLNTNAGIKDWDATVKEYLKKLSSQRELISDEQLNTVLNQTSTKLLSKFKIYFAQTLLND